MPDPSRINLNDILREERKSKLIPLENDFYDRASKQIRELEDEKRKIEDNYGTKYAIIEADLKTSREALEGIIHRRTTKIIKEARYNAEISSLHSPSRSKEKQDIDSMTQEERRLYERLLGLLTEYRTELLEKIFSKKEKKTASLPQDTEEEVFSDDKKDISKEYIVVRLLKDIPTFAGADGRNYTLAKEEVAVLSAINATALINRNAAIQISVKRRSS
ncbi:MAG: hypothetical protein J5U16_02700 [Candidatus Methanoperedens sp.]|nr:hypothetical protein [Candidatus Methanoperedens sp.]